MRIDAHHHVWDLERRDQPWTAALPALRRSFTLADLRPRLDAHGIDATILVQTVCQPDETAELLTLAAQNPWVAGVVGWVDLAAPDVARQIAALRGAAGGSHLVGVRHQVQDEPDPDWLGREDVRRGLAAVADAGLVYDLVVTRSQLRSVIRAVRALPDLRFVLDHAGKPAVATCELDPWRLDLLTLSDIDNVAVKLSGLVTEADHAAWTVEDLRPYAEVILEAFGPARTMFGSDWPVCLLAASYDQVVDVAETVTAHLTPTERAAIFGGAAGAWYGIAS